MAGLYGCEVHCFDPTPSVVREFAIADPDNRSAKGNSRSMPWGWDRFPWTPKKPMIWSSKARNARSSASARSPPNWDISQVDILKMDIEGGEMAALTEILTSGTLARLSVKQLLVEFHLWDDEHWGSFVKIISVLNEPGYLIFRKEFNPIDARNAPSSAFWVPSKVRRWTGLGEIRPHSDEWSR